MSPNPFPIVSAREAAEWIAPGSLVGFSGFTPAGAAKAIPRALAERARALEEAGRPGLALRVLSGASTGRSLDEALASAGAIAWRAPYQASRALRQGANEGRIEYVELHLSHLAGHLRRGTFGEMDWAVVEASSLTAEGEVCLTTSVGQSNVFLRSAKRVLIELNAHHSGRLREMHDLLELSAPPRPGPIGLAHPLEKIGSPTVRIDPAKIAGVVITNEPDEVEPFTTPDAAAHGIADHVVEFLAGELRAGRLPAGFLPIQSGVGNVANAVLACLGEHPEIPPFPMFSEVFQDACVDLMLRGRLTGASATALTLTPERLRTVYDNMDFFAPRVVLRPMEISNHPAIALQLGLIAMNTAVEVDLYGHVNSTHVGGTRVLNGIGGSGDFERNGAISIFMCPSVSHGGRISTIVPMCPHVDHNEHSVQIVVTEQGLADLRGLAPVARARRLIRQCAHPAYRGYLLHYLESAPPGHIRHDLAHCFDLHLNLRRHGSMLPGEFPA